MKKIAKLSLVAAVAVAGFSTANAQPLEEAIKNVEVSGSVVYRYNDYNNDEANGTKNGNTDESSSTNNNYKVALNLSSKVNEDVKFNSRFLVANEGGSFAVGGMDTQDEGDANPGVALSNAYFGYTGIANTTINVGKQGLTTPWTVAIDSDGNEQTGTGILALSTVGPVTLAAAYFNQSNLDKSTDSSVGGLNANKDVILDNVLNDRFVTEANLRELFAKGTPLSSGVAQLEGFKDIATVGAIVDLNPVTLDAWFLNTQDWFSSYTVGAKSNLDLSGVKLGVDARYAYLKLDENKADTYMLDRDNSIAKLVLTAKAGIVSGKLAYAMTDKDGGLTAVDNDATTTLIGWNLNANGKADADYWQAVVGVDILDNLNLSANYGNIEYAAWSGVKGLEIEEEEVYAQLVYKMSKNLSTYVRYGTYTKDLKAGSDKLELNDDVRGRLQVEYTF